MVFKYFNASEAAEIGASLADQFASGVNSVRAGKKSPPPPGSKIEEILARADRDVRPLQLNFYKKAKFANSFKWRLLEKGVEPSVADEVTQSLILHLAQNSQDPGSARGGDATSSSRADSAKLSDLVARAGNAQAEGKYEEAITLYREFIAIVPRQADALNNLGVALFSLARYQEAEQCYRQALEINPEFAGAYCNLADLLQANPKEAEECLRRALRINPKYLEARVNLGVSLANSGREHEAKACFKKALKIAPNSAEALLGLGRIARAEGHFAEAEKLIGRALKSKPKLPGALAALHGTRKMTLADIDWLTTTEETAGSGISLWEESELRFAIGKYHDDVGNYDLAFQSYRRGNELLKSVAQKYDRNAHSAFADDIIRGHSQQALAAFGEGGSASIKPIFVVGMPRSGTSLAEQIIASHPAAKGAGELDFWLDAARLHQGELRHGIIGEKTRKALAEEYLRFLARRCPDAPRVVDKTPINSDYLGLIHSVFPNARIIRMRRDPIDTGLSIYFQRFSTAMRFSMDLSDIADYYRVHQRLMSHWATALPAGTILEVPYEQLVTDQEAWTRKILDFLELEWDVRCLSFHETQRSVSTASAWQVRQKIYTQSVRRWRNYEKFIGPLKGLKD
jgi:tetratricopeptide (TPR) repeat protein